MKIETQIDTYNTLELDKVIYHRKFQCLPDPRGTKPGCKEEEPKFDIKPQVRVNTKIYTDGEIVETMESEPKNIGEYYINGIKYGQAVDTLIKKRVRVKNASYILIVTITNEIRRIGTRGFGFFDVIRNPQIFLNNPKDIMLGTKIYDGVVYAYVTVIKSGSTKEDLKYADGYIDSKTFQWETVANVSDQELTNLKNSRCMEIFVRKIDNEDGIQLPFTYIGRGHMEYIEGSRKKNGAHLFRVPMEAEATEDIYFDFRLPD